MAINFGALLRYAPAAAQGLGAYRKGAMAGEMQREAQERADAAALFEQFAKRRQLELQQSAQDQRTELRSMQDAANLERERMRNEAALEKANLQNKVDWFEARSRFGREGDQNPIGQPERIATERNRTQVGMNDSDNAAAWARALLSAQVARDRIAAQKAGQSNKPKSATQRQAEAQLDLGMQGAEGAAARYRAGYTPGLRDRVGEAMPDWAGNWLMSDDAQMLYSDLTKLVMASQYALSGKAVTETEARRLARSLVIKPGDKPARVEQKKADIQKRIDILSKNAGEESPVIDIGASGAVSPARAALQRIRGGR